MKDSEMQTRKILNYLYDEMNNYDKIAFENELKTKEDLRQEFLLQQKIDKSIQTELKVDKFKSIINQIHDQQIENKESKILNLQNKWYWAAASITIFSGTAIYSFRHHFNQPQQLFNSYYHKWQPSVIVRGLESEEFTRNLANDFDRGKYVSVLNKLETVPVDKNMDPKLILMKGCAQMETQDFNAAIETFNVFDSKNYTFYTEAGQWYQALCYLKTEEVEKSKQILKIIVQRNTSYAKEASELLKKLK